MWPVYHEGKAGKVLVPQGVDQLGAWYQPYMHSSSRTFNDSRKTYYSNFNLQAQVDKAERVARTIFNNLRRFYIDREYEIAEVLGVDPRKMYGDEGFLKKLFAALDSDLTDRTGKFPNLFATADILNESEKVKDEYIKKLPEVYRKQFKSLWKRSVKKSREETGSTGVLSKKDQANINDRGKDAFITTMSVDADIRSILKEKGLEYPDEVIFAFAVYLTTGQRMQGQAANIKKIEKELEGELEQISSFRKSGPSQISPIVTTKTSKNYGKVKKKGTLKQHIQNPLHTSVEDVIAYQLKRLNTKGYGKMMGSLVKFIQKGDKNITITATKVGQKQKRTKDESDQQVFIDDVVITFENEFGDSINAGIDIKAYKQGNDKSYKYGRGGIVKQPIELTKGDAIIPLAKLEAFVYLAANSYFYDRDTFDQLLSEPKTGKVGELYQVINWIRGIYGLLPAAPIDFSGFNSFSNVADFVKQDTRTFVLLNDKLMFMTQFLAAVEKQVLKGGKQRNTVQLLSQNFTDTLKSIYGTRRKLTGLKQEKKDYLRELNAPAFWLQSQSESLSYYNKLHQKFIQPAFGGKLLNKWKYRIVTEFKIT